MIDQLTIHLRRAEGALVRLLGLAERRGFSAVSMTAAPMASDTMLIHLTVRAERPLDNLILQLEKLYDVQHVEKTR